MVIGVASDVSSWRNIMNLIGQTDRDPENGKRIHITAPLRYGLWALWVLQFVWKGTRRAANWHQEPTCRLLRARLSFSSWLTTKAWLPALQPALSSTSFRARPFCMITLLFKNLVEQKGTRKIAGIRLIVASTATGPTTHQLSKKRERASNLTLGTTTSRLRAQQKSPCAGQTITDRRGGIGLRLDE